MTDQKVTPADVLQFIGSGEAIADPLPPSNDDSAKHSVWSTKDRLLPTEVDLTDPGRCRFKGYINNLHHKHVELYRVIEQMLDVAIPMFDKCNESQHYPTQYSLWPQRRCNVMNACRSPRSTRMPDCES